MNRSIHLLALCAAAVTLPLQAGAAQGSNAKVACTVNVDYVLNNVVQQSYARDFTAEPGVPFNDDFSTQIRQRSFSATVTRESGDTVVSIDYFNDVGVFHSIGFNTRLAIRGSGSIEATAGSNSFSTSLGVAGNHVTNYRLSCKRV